MNRKLIIRLGVTTLAVFAVAYAASPLVATSALVQAAKAGNQKGLERQVDFPAFRSSLKDELNARMMVEMRKDKRMAGSGLSGLGMLLAPAIVGGAVDAFVTPQAIALMVQDGRAPKPLPGRDAPSPPVEDDAKRVRQSWSYRDLDTFAVTLTRDDKPDEAVSLLMKRRYMFRWKLAGIDLGTPE